MVTFFALRTSSLLRCCCWAALSVVLLGACNGLGDTPTSGGLRIGVDETLAPVGEAELEIFESTYDNAEIHASYQAEARVINDLLNNRISLALVSRELTAAEKNTLEQQKIRVASTPIATDALVLLTHRNNPYQELTYEQIQHILSGKITKWEQLGGGKKTGNINLVFDQAGSSTVSNVLQLSQIPQLPANAYAAGTNAKVAQYVAQNTNGLGITSLCWIGDDSNDSTDIFYDQTNVVAIGKRNAPADSMAYYLPSQENLLTQNYPLQRPVLLLNREGRAGIGTGFAAFAASERGQRIVLRAGLFPYHMPTRQVIIKKSF